MGEATARRELASFGADSAGQSAIRSDRTLSGRRTRQRQARGMAAQSAPDSEYADRASGVQGNPHHTQCVYDPERNRHLRRQGAGRGEEGNSSLEGEMRRRAFVQKAVLGGLGFGVLRNLEACAPRAAIGTGAADTFAALRDRYFLFQLKKNPVTSTYLGGDAYDPSLRHT